MIIRRDKLIPENKQIINTAASFTTVSGTYVVFNTGNKMAQGDICRRCEPPDGHAHHGVAL